MDLIFSFFSHKFHIPKTVQLTPVLAAIGLFVYSVWPFFFTNSIYAGLVLATIIFSAAGGLGEVLISPVIASIPSDDPDREMSKLHSVYAWGVVFVVIFSTIFLLLFGTTHWQMLAFLFLLIPLTSAILFRSTTIPTLETPEQVSGALALLKNKGIWICVFAIFLGGASECTMAQWSSGYLEQALGIPKIWGDLFGVALFSVMLGLGRTLYSKFGKNIALVLFAGSIGATCCYLIAVISPVPLIGLLACAFTGFCVSMLWPGSLIIASDRFPSGGVFIYALMAAGGDLGASIGPQLLGIITDITMVQPSIVKWAQTLGFSAEQFGMKIGMLVCMLFPLTGIWLYASLWYNIKKEK